MDGTLATYRQFAALIESTLKSNLATPQSDISHPSGIVSIGLGLVFARAVVGLPQVCDPPPPVGKVIDGVGHDRPMYRGLLVASWLRAMEMEQASWSRELTPWCESLAADLLAPADAPRAETGWNALALHLAAAPLDRSDWRGLSAKTFERLASEQQPSGALFAPSSIVNPETRWYEELTLLHAMSSYAVAARDRRIESTVLRATEFHFRETQPDHATHQPWALFAFLSNPSARIQAGEILHTATMRDFRNVDAISLLLLADALWCLRLSLSAGHAGM